MKLLAVIFFTLSTLASAPTVCAHALAPQSASDMNASHHGAHEDAAMDIAHHEHDGDNRDAGEHSGHDSCPDGCNGGAGCDGCTVAMSAIAAISSDTMIPDFSVAAPLARSLYLGQTIGIEPPPPRGMSA
ncbi:MAG: hypothetical protein AAFX54_15565 [Pseudomonadota bacterium]